MDDPIKRMISEQKVANGAAAKRSHETDRKHTDKIKSALPGVDQTGICKNEDRRDLDNIEQGFHYPADLIAARTSSSAGRKRLSDCALL